jgi:phage baseplate assembly protein gpV
MNRLLNVMRMQAQMQAGGSAQTRIGIVDSYDPANYCAKVRIQPEDTVTGWLPVLSPWVGNGWGFFAPPSVGDLVEIQYQEDDFNAGFVCQRFYNDSARPLPVVPGEFWLVHQSGSCLKFHNDGSIEMIAASNLTASAPNGTLRLSGQNVQMHASNTYRFDVNGQGQKWDGSGVETWQDNDITKPHHPHAPPEIS